MVPWKVNVIFLNAYEFFFFQRRNFLVFTGFCEVVVTRQKLRLLIESKPLVFQR